jgi:hypothetical protein
MSVRQQLPQGLMRPVGRHGFHQERIESRGAAPGAILGSLPTRHSDEPNVLAEHVAQRLGKRASVDDRHVEIKAVLEREGGSLF